MDSQVLIPNQTSRLLFLYDQKLSGKNDIKTDKTPLNQKLHKLFGGCSGNKGRHVC